MDRLSPLAAYDRAWLLDNILQHRRQLVSANLVAILAVAAAVPIPLLMPLLVDEVLLDQPGALLAAMNSFFPVAWQGPVGYILGVLVVSIILRTGSVLLNVWQTREFTIIGKDITYRMRRDLLRHLERTSMAEYELMGSGSVASRFVTDINTIDEFIGASISKLLVAVLTLVGVAMVLLWMNWQLALLILFLNPMVVYLTVLLGKRVKELKARENSAFESFQQTLTESLDAIQQIRAANRERFFLGKVAQRARDIRTHSANFSWRSDAAGRLSFSIFLAGFDVFRAISMIMVLLTDLSVGQMLAVFAYLWFMMGPVEQVLNIQYAWFGAKAALGRVNDLLLLHQEPDYPHLKNPFPGKETVSLEVVDVSFAYGDKEPILKHVSLSLRPGEKIALVGASGGGKSTLVQIIIGLYPPSSGQLYFDGVPVTEIGLDVVRENVATVLQHPALLNDTVRANLTLGREYPDEEMWGALRTAQLETVVRELPAGLETVIGRQGIRLSGGQRQRLSIARMLLADPKVVILDEATSALDNETEAALHAALGAHLHNRTLIIVAHRLSAVRQADRVYVFEDGHIIEQGSHKQLIGSDGLYNKLYRDHECQ
ncbi:MAG: ABC transporter ATP-binding protein [Pseudomonadota bacterium]|nr:ABC transporter ATP-binding protein [Pseudomonadota bacterium]